MFCKCGSKTKVTNTVAGEEEVIRERICPSCGVRYITLEQLVSEEEEWYANMTLKEKRRENVAKWRKRNVED